MTTDPTYAALDGARRVAWARSYTAEETAGHMIVALFLVGHRNAACGSDFVEQFADLMDGWQDDRCNRAGWVDGDIEPPSLTPWQVEARGRIARRVRAIVDEEGRGDV